MGNRVEGILAWLSQICTTMLNVSQWSHRAYMLVFLFLLLECNANQTAENPQSNASPAPEIMYHVVQRSFFDSDGNENGDLNGLREKLDYLQELGVTSILMLPLYASPFYHNYFADDFEKIDPDYGTKEDYLELIEEIHHRGMKLYMDMETQYVTEDHLWFRDSYGNLSSSFSDYISYDDSAHTRPSTIIYDLKGLKGFDGVFKKITTVNMNSEKVRDYNIKLFSYWVDPNGDGDFSDGVDGFRLDHMMNDLDNKGRWTNLFENFWNPLMEKVKSMNPKVIFMAEQADWGSLGLEYLNHTGVDRVFAFRIAFEIRNFNKKKLESMADSTFNFTPKGKNQIVFIENHDMPRFATVVNQNAGMLKTGAALNLLLGGIPSIYYGQELGMTGAGGFMKFGMTDANEIPEREAFEWYKPDSGKGMAFWYKNSGPWCDSTNVKPNDGISLEEEEADSSSLWHFYKDMIQLRKSNSVFASGSYQTVPNNNDSVFSFLRKGYERAALVVVNLSGSPENLTLDVRPFPSDKNIRQLWGKEKAVIENNNISIQLPAHAINIYELVTP